MISDNRIVFPIYFKRQNDAVQRSYLLVIIAVVAVIMVSAGAYGILATNIIPVKQDQIKVPDYSSQLDSLNTQVNSINSQVSSLNTQVNSLNSQINSLSTTLGSLDNVNSNIADIHEKLADLENMKINVADIQTKLNYIGNQTSQVASSSGKIFVALDKSTYLPGDKIHISGTGADPLKAVQIQLLDSNGFTLMGQNTWADSTGSVLYGLQLSSAILPGEYQVKLTSGQMTGSQPVTISTASSTTSGSYTLTAQTDRGIYQGGDTIQVTGTAQPNTAVTAVMQSASNTSFTSGTTANSDGSYTILFSTTSSYEAGTWSITVTNLSQTKTLTIYLQSAGTSTGSSTFTAQTDKTSYNLGDMIQVTGTAQPSSTVTAVMTNPSGGTYSSSTTVNSNGSYTILFSTTTSYESGNWNINVSNLGQSKILYFTLGTSSSSTSTLTAQTDKASYTRGDLIQVAGAAQPNTTVTATMVSPSGTNYNTSTTANSNGNYVMFFSTTIYYPTGNWYIEVSNNGKTKILSFTMQ